MEKIQFNGVKREEQPDPRNYTIARFIPRQDTIEDEEFCLEYLPQSEIILNQGSYGSCVAHSFALCKSILEYRHTKKWIDFDPYMIYGTRYAEDRYNGVGMLPKQGAKCLYRDGAYLRRQFGKTGEMPSIKEEVDEFKSNNPNLVAKAKDYVIDGYAFVRTVDEIKAALKNSMPVSATWEIYESFYTTKSDGIVPNPKKYSDGYEGDHQMTIIGWTKGNRWIVANSWGTNRGMKGIYFISFTYAPIEAIAVTDTITPSLKKANEIKITIGSNMAVVDDEVKFLDSPAQIYSDRTFVPVRFVAEALGASVEWVEAEQKVIIRSEEAEIELVIGSRTIRVNGKIFRMDVAPRIVNDRTLLPIRMVAEALNCDVEWNESLREVYIKAL